MIEDLEGGVGIQPASRKSTLPVFVAFAGGGAKGLVHVGALKALEAKEVEICGVAGTSAGAIVAALKASGFSADEMADPAAQTTLLDALSKIDSSMSSAPDLFGPGGWDRVASFRRAVECGLPRIAVAFALSSGILLLLTMVAVASYGSAAACVLWACWIAAAFFGKRWLSDRLEGLAQLDSFQTALGRLIAEKAFPDEPGRVVTMADYGVTGLLPLKIVGANLSTRRLALFSAETTPQVPVAEAVAASISLPVVFRPTKIGGETFVDGGIVSNLPAWPFDEERELDPDTVTIAFEIAEEVPESEEIGPSNWLSAALRTALFGSGVLNLRAVGRAELIELRTNLNVLDFDLGKASALKQIQESKIAADLELERRLFARPALYRRACETMIVAVSHILDAGPVVKRLPAATRRVRVSLAMRDPGHRRSLRLRYGAGYADDLDERLLLPMDSSIVGHSWTTGSGILELAPFAPAIGLSGRKNRYRRKLVWQDMAWVLCVPIFRDEAPETAEPEFVVSVDCNECPDQSFVETFVELVSELIIDSFGDLLIELEKVGGAE